MLYLRQDKGSYVPAKHKQGVVVMKMIKKILPYMMVLALVIEFFSTRIRRKLAHGE